MALSNVSFRSEPLCLSVSPFEWVCIFALLSFIIILARTNSNEIMSFQSAAWREVFAIFFPLAQSQNLKWQPQIKLKMTEDKKKTKNEWEKTEAHRFNVENFF